VILRKYQIYANTRAQGANRPAYTLIEVIAVITIITILVSLAAWGAFSVLGGQQWKNTASTIRVVDKVLQTDWRFVIDEAKKDTISPAVIALAQPDPTGERAKVLWIKIRLMEAFPQSYADIGTPTALPFVYQNGWIPTAQQRYIAQYQAQMAAVNCAMTAPTTPAQWQAQSSACLRLALSISRGGSSLTDDQIKYALADTNTDGLNEIVDGWGNPMAFFRFPWNNAALLAANPGASNPKTAVFADPIDSGGTLINLGWYNNNNGNALIYVNNFHSVAYSPPPTTPPLPAPPGMPTQLPAPPLAAPLPAQNTLAAYYVTPVIVSGGSTLFTQANGNLGLNFPDMSLAPAPASAAGNIFSFTLRGS
jgi:prepilin-type N-terminal cleavage/methylation domain-containing protein